MKLNQITNHLYHLKFFTQLGLTSTFLRFQEYYESPEFRGKIFSLEEYKKWYISNSLNGKKKGKFTYYADWSGFNIPSNILEPFYEGKFDPLSKKEIKILDLFKDRRHEKNYIIGTYRNINNIRYLEHEIAHGLYYTLPSYKKKVLEVFNEINENNIRKIEHFLSHKGYHKEVFNDEIQAYLLDSDYLEEKKVVEKEQIIGYSEKLNKIFNHYFSQETNKLFKE